MGETDNSANKSASVTSPLRQGPTFHFSTITYCRTSSVLPCSSELQNQGKSLEAFYFSFFFSFHDTKHGLH